MTNGTDRLTSLLHSIAEALGLPNHGDCGFWLFHTSPFAQAFSLWHNIEHWGTVAAIFGRTVAAADRYGSPILLSPDLFRFIIRATFW
jgi:hypothetical protein